MTIKEKEEKTTSKSSFATLLKDFNLQLPKVADLVKGKVISADNSAVRVDISGVAVGVVRGKELFSE